MKVRLKADHRRGDLPGAERLLPLGHRAADVARLVTAMAETPAMESRQRFGRRQTMFLREKSV